MKEYGKQHQRLRPSRQEFGLCPIKNAVTEEPAKKLAKRFVTARNSARNSLVIANSITATKAEETIKTTEIAIKCNNNGNSNDGTKFLPRLLANGLLFAIIAILLASAGSLYSPVAKAETQDTKQNTTQKKEEDTDDTNSSEDKNKTQEINTPQNLTSGSKTINVGGFMECEWANWLLAHNIYVCMRSYLDYMLDRSPKSKNKEGEKLGLLLDNLILFAQIILIISVILFAIRMSVGAIRNMEKEVWSFLTKIMIVAYVLFAVGAEGLLDLYDYVIAMSDGLVKIMQESLMDATGGNPTVTFWDGAWDGFFSDQLKKSNCLQSFASISIFAWLDCIFFEITGIVVTNDAGDPLTTIRVDWLATTKEVLLDRGVAPALIIWIVSTFFFGPIGVLLGFLGFATIWQLIRLVVTSMMMFFSAWLCLMIMLFLVPIVLVFMLMPAKSPTDNFLKYWVYATVTYAFSPMLYTMFLIITLTLLTQVNNGFNSLFKENLTEYALNPKTISFMGANFRQGSAAGANTAATSGDASANAGSTIGGGDDAGKCKGLKNGNIEILCAPSTANTGLFPAPGVMTSGYGWRWGRMHKGYDIAAPTGTEIVAAASGTVTYSQWNSGGYGYLVVVGHPCVPGSEQCYETLYAHNSKLLVKQWQKVEQGQVIALMGNTGRSYGPHLHFEVQSGRSGINALQQPPIMIDTSQTYHAGAGVTDKIGKTIEAGVNTAGRAVSNAIGGTMKSLGLAFTGVEMTKERLMDAVMYFFMSIAIVQIAIELGKIVKDLATTHVKNLAEGSGGGGRKLENINKTKAATKEPVKAGKVSKQPA